jgi:hypothetical protein
MTSSPLLSQTHSSDSTLIAVPRHTLQKALVIKAQYELCDAELILVKDKVSLLEKKIELKDSQIVNLNTIVKNTESIIIEKDNIIAIKESEIKVLKSEKRKKYFSGLATGGSIGIVAMTLLFLL